jgi:hydrogenase expression/formation protein HypE
VQRTTRTPGLDEAVGKKGEIVMLKAERVLMAHGAGGSMMHRLIREVVLRHLKIPDVHAMDDAAALRLDTGRIAFSTDSFVVKPLFFPGGDIGSLAVSGTVNDLLMKGAQPLFLSLGLVIEEGFPLDDLESILASTARTCEEAGVRVVTGDTKVVGKGDADGIYLNTSGMGPLLPGVDLSGLHARPGDAVLVSGTLGEHGIAVLSQRNGLNLTGEIRSDAAPLHSAVLPLLRRFPGAVHVLRDPTRGGAGATLNEIAEASRVRITVREEDLPVSDPVRSVCDLLGLDPLYLPCEGRYIAIIQPEAAETVLDMLQNDLQLSEARRIGTVSSSDRGEVLLETRSGGHRIIDMPTGELLPRIC